MNLILEEIKENITDKLERAIYTLEFCHYPSLTDADLEALKAWCDEQGYVYADGREKHWNRFWITKGKVAHEPGKMA